MKSRRRLYAILITVVVLVVAYPTWCYLRIRSYQTFIHSQYDAEFNQLVNTTHVWPEDAYSDEEAYRKVEQLEDDLKAIFSNGDFYCASWSHDSHHGLRSTGIPDQGYTTFDILFFRASGPKSQSLAYGRTHDGVPLLVYERWLPDAPIMRHIRIVFYREKVDKRRESRAAS